MHRFCINVDLQQHSVVRGCTHRILIVSKIIQHRAGVGVLDSPTRGFATARRSNQGLYKTETGWNGAAESSCDGQRNPSQIERVQSEKPRASPGIPYSSAGWTSSSDIHRLTIRPLTSPNAEFYSSGQARG